MITVYLVLAAAVDLAALSTSLCGEYSFACAWGGTDSVSSELVGTLKTLVEKLSTSAPPKYPPVQTGVYKKSFFCGVSPLGAHVSEDIRQKIWNNAYVEIWSLITVDQPMVDKELRVGENPLIRSFRLLRPLEIASRLSTFRNA